MSKDYMYPIRVWLTSASLGTVLVHFVTYIKSYFSFIGTLAYQQRTTANLFSYFVIICIIALVASIPCLLTFWGAYSRLVKSNLQLNKVKWGLMIVGQVLCWTLFCLVSLLDDDLFLITEGDIVLPYALVVALSTWFYFPKGTSIQQLDEL